MKNDNNIRNPQIDSEKEGSLNTLKNEKLIKKEQSSADKEKVASGMSVQIAEKKTEAPEEKPSQKTLGAILTVLIIIIGILSVATVLRFSSQGVVVSDIVNEQEAEPAVVADLSPDNNKMNESDLDPIKKEHPYKNTVYSPLSIRYALAMLSDGAAGETKQQIDTVLGNNKPSAYLNSKNRSIANAMMIRDDFTDAVKESYIDTINGNYGASLISDSFKTPERANKWVSDNTLGIINNVFDEGTINENIDYVLINALAIDMQWKNQLQCEDLKPEDRIIPCKKTNGDYSISYPHEKHHNSVVMISGGYDKVVFQDSDKVDAALLGADANRYDIINELGEEYIRKTVLDEYNKWLVENSNDESLDRNFDIEQYMSELASSYGSVDSSTDFSYYETDEEKVFAKDLQEYDGETLQYVGIMPKKDALQNYNKVLTVQKIAELIDRLKDASDINSYKEGVITSVSGHIPFFKYEYRIENLIDDLRAQGITNVFDPTTADLSGVFNYDKESLNKPYIDIMVHAASIDFSNNGITAAAITAAGGRGAAGGGRFEYDWDVPVEKIDITFDKPFMYLIRNKRNGEIWFIGEVYYIDKE